VRQRDGGSCDRSIGDAEATDGSLRVIPRHVERTGEDDQGVRTHVPAERPPAMIGWALVALTVSALVAIGAGALVAPRWSASQYGIVLDDPRGLALVRAMGIRDVVIGVLLGLLAATRSRELVAWALCACMLIAFLDFVVVTTDRTTTGARARTRGISPRGLHAAGGIGLGIAAAVLQAGY
jgi:hypothetical protein